MDVLLVLLVTILACSAGCFAVLYAAAVIGLLRSGVPLPRAVRLSPALPREAKPLRAAAVVLPTVPVFSSGSVETAQNNVRLQTLDEIANPPLAAKLVVPAPRTEKGCWAPMASERTSRKTLPLTFLVGHAGFSFVVASMMLVGVPDRNAPLQTNVHIEEGATLGKMVLFPVAGDD